MADDDTDAGRRPYHESAYGDVGDADGDEEPLDPGQLPDDVEPHVGRDGDAVNVVNVVDAGPETAAGDSATAGRDSVAGERHSATAGNDSGLTRVLDRVAETLATVGIYVAVAATAIVPFGLVAIAADAQPVGNYLVTGSFAGWLVAMALALLAGLRETDPYANAEEKKEVEQGFF